MEKFTYDFSKDFKKVFENLTSGHYEEDVQSCLLEQARPTPVNNT